MTFLHPCFQNTNKEFQRSNTDRTHSVHQFQDDNWFDFCILHFRKNRQFALAPFLHFFVITTNENNAVMEATEQRNKTRIKHQLDTIPKMISMEAINDNTAGATLQVPAISKKREASFTNCSRWLDVTTWKRLCCSHLLRTFPKHLFCQKCFSLDIFVNHAILVNNLLIFHEEKLFFINLSCCQQKNALQDHLLGNRWVTQMSSHQHKQKCQTNAWFENSTKKWLQEWPKTTAKVKTLHHCGSDVAWRFLFMPKSEKKCWILQQWSVSVICATSRHFIAPSPTVKCFFFSIFSKC